jgi:hypothetical protein
VRVNLTNASIAFFQACSAVTVNQSCFMFIFLACLCTTVNWWETRQRRSKEHQVAKLDFDWLHPLLPTEDANSQDDDAPVGAALQDDTGIVAILPRKQTKKKPEQSHFFLYPIEDWFEMLGRIICFSICIILMPNVSADSLLEFLRTEDRQNQFSFFGLLILLTLSLRMKVCDRTKYLHIVLTNFVFNCIVHLAFNTLSNLHFEEKDCTATILCAVFVMGYIIYRAYCLGNLSHKSNYGMQMLLLYAVFEDAQVSWEKAAFCGIFICILLYVDSETEWPCRDTVTTPLCIVPGSRIYRQGCWCGDSPNNHVTKEDKWMKNYKNDIKIMAFVVLSVNWLLIYLHCYNTHKRLRKVWANYQKRLEQERLKKARANNQKLLEEEGNSFAQYPFTLMHVAFAAGLHVYVIIMLWSAFEIIPSQAQFNLFQILIPKKSIFVQVLYGDFSNDKTMSITCSWSQAHGASTANNVSNSSWWHWS